MGRVKNMSADKMVRRLAPIAFAATLCLGAAACGSTNKVSPNNGPTTTVQPGASTTVPAPTTTAPKSGGAGF